MTKVTWPDWTRKYPEGNPVPRPQQLVLGFFYRPYRVRMIKSALYSLSFVVLALTISSWVAYLAIIPFLYAASIWPARGLNEVRKQSNVLIGVAASCFLIARMFDQLNIGGWWIPFAFGALMLFVLVAVLIAMDTFYDIFKYTVLFLEFRLIKPLSMQIRERIIVPIEELWDFITS